MVLALVVRAVVEVLAQLVELKVVWKVKALLVLLLLVAYLSEQLHRWEPWCSCLCCTDNLVHKCVVWCSRIHACTCDKTNLQSHSER